MIIYTSAGTVRANIHQTDDSDVYQKISDEEYASIKFTYNSFIPFDRGDYVILYNNKYTLKKKPAPIEEDGNNKYVYTLKFESPRAELSEVNFELFDSTSLLVIPVYDEDTIYCKDSVVSYSSKVWRYIYTTGDLGKTPSEGTYWTEIPVWSVSTAYVIGNFVYSSNVVYKCITANTGQPLKEGDYWTVVNTAPAFDFTTVLSPANYAKMICDNMNRARSTQNWVVGYTIPYDPKEQAFSNVTCLEAAGTVASLFETEFWVDMNGSNFQLNIGKRVYTTTPEITLSQGKNNGLVNITRNEITESKKVTRLIALGAEKNLYGTYRNGSKRLMLPDRYYIDSANIDQNSPLEDVQVWEDIYPCMQFATDDYDFSKSYLAGDQVLYGSKSWDCILACTGVTPVSGSNWKLSEGQITSVVTTTVTASTTLFKFVDANMTFNPLDPAYIMSDGTRPKVHFVTGNLAGYEFPITSFDNTTKEFTISQIQDSTDSNLPTVGYTFSQYDRFNLVDLYMPQTYVTKAENRLLARATDYLNKYSVDQVSYSSPIDVIWATNNAIELKIGQIIRLVSTTFGLNEEYRITSLARNITLPYKYTVELSNTPYVPSKITKITDSISKSDMYLEMAGLKDVMFKSKSFRGAKEAIDMSFDPDGAYFTEKIKPLIVETSAVLAGTNEQQFSLSSISFSTIAGQKNYISWTAGSITDDKYNSPARTWTIPNGNFTASDGDSSTYYCYVKSPRNVALTSAYVIFDTLAHKTDTDTDYWWFLVGTLGSVKDNMRQFYTSYGWTFINGGTIYGQKIQSANGTCVFDLVNNEIKGVLKFTSGASVSDAINATNAAVGTAQSTADNAVSGLISKQDAVVGGKAIISGGYINADLIYVDSLIARHFTTGTSGERITLNIDNDNSLKIYDASNIMRVKLGYKSGVPAFIFYDSSGNETFNLSSLGIGGALTATQSLIFNNGTYAKTIDIDNNGDITIHGNLHVTGNMYAENEISAYGSGTGSGSGGSGGLIQAVYSYASLNGSFSDTVLTDTFNAYTINRLASRISTLETNPTLTYSNVVAALGFTPYSNANPTGYITASALSGYATQSWVGSNFRLNVDPSSGSWFQGTPRVSSDGVMEIGKYIDMHVTNTGTTDYDVRLEANANGGLYINGVQVVKNSGTWGINVTGYSGSTKLLSDLGYYVWSAASLPQSFQEGLQCSFVRSSDGFPSYGSLLMMRTVSDGGGSLQLYVPYSPNYGGNTLKVRFGNYDVDSGNSWTTFRNVLQEDTWIGNKYFGSDGNITTSSITLTTGAGSNKVLTSDASGNATWQSGISVSSITTGNITSSGNITATGEVTAYYTSDINLKTSISILSNPFELIRNINAVSYLWNNTAKQLNPNKSDFIQYGVIAQELEKVRPEWVHDMYGGKYKGVDYVQMIPVLLACIQQQQKEIDILKNKIVK